MDGEGLPLTFFIKSLMNCLVNGCFPFQLKLRGMDIKKRKINGTSFFGVFAFELILYCRPLGPLHLLIQCSRKVFLPAGTI